jgi:hypothetical protein
MDPSLQKPSRLIALSALGIIMPIFAAAFVCFLAISSGESADFYGDFNLNGQSAKISGQAGDRAHPAKADMDLGKNGSVSGAIDAENSPCSPTASLKDAEKKKSEAGAAVLEACFSKNLFRSL